MKTSNQLLFYVQRFFQNYLAAQRAVSPNTILAYRDSLKLFLAFVRQHLQKSAAKLTLDHLTVETVLAFLDNVETHRKNTINTRNQRLAALHTFFSYLVTEDPSRGDQYQKIIVTPIKKAVQPLMGYLEVNELKAIFDSIDQASFLGRRDYTLLNLLYNTGSRIQEICDLKVENIRHQDPPLVSFMAKGQKIRQLPLWKETATLMKNYMTERKIINKPQDIIFISKKGTPLNRFSVGYMIKSRVEEASKKCPSLSSKKITPHTFRHTTAMHLLQSAVDITSIKSWLGHANLSTTHAYLEIDLDMKRKALSACTPMGTPQKLQKAIKQNQDVFKWLDTLGTPSVMLST